MLLVDPLAVFFQPALATQPPLRLDTAHVEVELLPPLARVAVTRSFTNHEAVPIEAVLTLPAALPGEIVHGLTVSIDGTAWHAVATPRADAGQAHDDAIGDGRLAILHEVMGQGVQIVSIAGLAPGGVVAVRIESVRPLQYREAGIAVLRVMLGADPLRINIRLGDAEALTTVPDKHPASLTVTGDGLTVTVDSHPPSPADGRTLAIDCVRPAVLHIAAEVGHSLDSTAVAASDSGGWEAVRDPSTSVAEIVGRRSNWISGCLVTDAGDIRVIAPWPPAAGASPAVRAITAFAAAHCNAAAGQADLEVLRLAANLLTPATSLAFVGPLGVARGAIPLLRKVALPHEGFDAIGREPHVPVPLAPPPPQWHPEPPAPDLPIKEDPIIPGPVRIRKSNYVWVTVAPVLVALTGLVAALRFVLVPLWPLIIAFVVLMLLNAGQHFPRGPVRRRLPWLVLLLLPALVSMVAGPFGLVGTDFDDAGRARWIGVQQALVIAGFVQPWLMAAGLPGGRRFTLDLGALGFLAAFFAASVAIITWSPGS